MTHRRVHLGGSVKNPTRSPEPGVSIVRQACPLTVPSPSCPSPSRPQTHFPTVQLCAQGRPGGGGGGVDEGLGATSGLTGTPLTLTVLVSNSGRAAVRGPSGRCDREPVIANCTLLREAPARGGCRLNYNVRGKRTSGRPSARLPGASGRSLMGLRAPPCRVGEHGPRCPPAWADCALQAVACDGRRYVLSWGRTSLL